MRRCGSAGTDRPCQGLDLSGNDGAARYFSVDDDRPTAGAGAVLSGRKLCLVRAPHKHYVGRRGFHRNQATVPTVTAGIPNKTSASTTVRMPPLRFDASKA